MMTMQSLTNELFYSFQPLWLYRKTEKCGIQLYGYQGRTVVITVVVVVVVANAK